MSVRIGIVGGSGLYNMKALERREVQVETPWAPPRTPTRSVKSLAAKSPFSPATAAGIGLVPLTCRFRANIHGFKQLGVEWLLSFSAVGSLKEELEPLHFVIPDQFFDRTKGRPSTFFDEDVVAHVGFAHPVCSVLGGIAAAASRKAGVTVHTGGTYCCMEGPQFSTLAESNFHRACGFDVIGMTNLQEAKLAREAEMSYATVAMVTDYDCWHEEHDAVTVEQIIECLTKNAANAEAAAIEAVKNIPDGPSPHADALRNAIITDRGLISDHSKKKYSLLLGKYL